MLLKIFIILLSLVHCNLFCKQIIKLGVEDINYYPIYGAYNFDGIKMKDYEGLVADILKFYNKSQNDFEIVFNPRPIKRLYMEFLDSKSDLDAKFPDNPLWKDKLKIQSKQKILYSDPILEYTDGAFVFHENKKIALNEIRKIGTLSGFDLINYDTLINNKKTILEEYNNVNILFEKLLTKSVDMIYLNKSLVECFCQREKKNSQILFRSDFPNSKGYYYISTFKYPQFIKSFNLFIKQKKGDINNINQYYKKYKCN
ncbi:hypothetical protein [Fluviispira vulneris]|uniref:hypothetical protein n=1 Tax=Fluviispira vulneris TaxID=2763012 RepID=UPI001646A805|nr:hypothetical protein [Fluviispira vulneris]